MRAPSCFFVALVVALAACSGRTVDSDSNQAVSADRGDDQGARAYIGNDPGALFDGFVDSIRDLQRVSTDDLNALGTTWDAELARARNRFVSAKTPADVYY